MKKKFIHLLIFFLFTQNCGYSPIHSSQNKSFFKFNVTEFNGNIEMNEIINMQIQRYSNNLSNNKINLKVFSYYEKEILSKDKKGEPTKFLIKKIINFKLIASDENKSFSFNKETAIDNIDDKFELNNYEKSLKQDFISSSIDELILKLSGNQ